MQDYNARGVIQRILSKSPSVFIFVFKTIEQYPLTIKAKKFRPKEMDEQTFLGLCEAFAQDQIVSLRNSRVTTEKVVAGPSQQPVVTSDGQPVWAPVIVVDFLALEAASIHLAPKPAPTPELAPPPQQPPAGQDAKQRFERPEALAPAPAPQQTPVNEATDGFIPFIPFD